jgi:acylphosphatase
MPTNHILIKGKVQGVFFRATAKDVANELGLTGWIKNTKEGDVEATVSGDDQQLKKFIKWCKQGPDRAIVEEVIINQEEETTFKSFTVIR